MLDPGSGAGASVSGPVMADVRGLTTADAKQVLTDLNLGVVTVTVREAPSVGRPGTVVAQDPPAGEPAADVVTLVVAASAVIPAVVGTPVAQATRDLEQLGAHVIVQRVYRPDVAVDTVLQVQPAAGRPAATNVVLTVSSPPAAVYLADLNPVAGRCSKADENVNGTAYHHSLRCTVATDVDEVEYLLNRRTVRLEGVLGQADTGEPGQVLRFELLGDGKVLVAMQLGYGQSKPVQVSTVNVLRLTLRVGRVGSPAPGTGSVPAIFGDIRVVGGPSDVVALTESVR